MLPMLASDYIEGKLKFPLIMQPKIDGVRGLNLLGQLTGRSLKTHANKYVTATYSHRACVGLDGELAAQSETHPDLCRLTTSAVNTIEGEPFTLWHVFDLVNNDTLNKPYVERLDLLERHVTLVKETEAGLTNRIRTIPWLICESLEQMIHKDTLWLAAGYEGSILRAINGKYKQGRSTPTEGGLLRIKRFAEAEAIVRGVIEGEQNLNEATVNETGHTARSTHKANMVPNGMVGALDCTDCKTGKEITVAAGRMTHGERKAFFDFPQRIVGQTIKYKTFLKGVKDLPRFPTYQCIRAPSDIG